jgi:methionyl aminopeptidase
VESYAKKYGFSMIKLPVTTGHSLGSLHMDGWLIPLYNSPRNEGRVLKTGMVITIETFMSAGSGEAYILNDENGAGITKDGALACYWEHAVAVTDAGCEILDLRADEDAAWAKMVQL